MRVSDLRHDDRALSTVRVAQFEFVELISDQSAQRACAWKLPRVEYVAGV
jgi:hypothetical protein